MMIDLTGSEKAALNTFVERPTADDRHPASPPIRTLEAIVAKLEPPRTVVDALSLGGRAWRWADVARYSPSPRV